jgi:hypothetical protein
MDTTVRLLVANVAISEGPLGIVSGFQFSALFQLAKLAFAFHVALPAKVLLAAESRSSEIAIVITENDDRKRRRGNDGASIVDE